MLNEKFKNLLIVQKTTELLKNNDEVRMPIETLKEHIHLWLPNEDADKVVTTLVGWGRYSEYFGYNDNAKVIYLDRGQEVG